MLRFKLFVQKFFFRLVFIGALLAFFGVFAFALQLEKYNKPPATMRMPESSKIGKPEVAGETHEENRLKIQHMSADEVALQLNQVIADSLSFNKDTYASGTEAMKKYFTDEGYQQYIQF
ncbi:MAG: hypothetical protein DI551_12330 [Micavibrio aeruginosavorus]|uniref:Uncharacterized protein n=1 Tax=Micavibrio aeruginosavorus TaxID=349221 RepID=A0A2W5MT30_9BACT|nr:MAG: hypothetical protein DI551_12330 [Micavibrio aeruginosavorus]